MSKLSRRNAFTLVELLVVIAIIGILVGLLLPAVQQIREAARRAQCQNNLKQQALAMHNFEAAFKALPVGVQVTPNNAGAVTITYTQKQGLWAWSTFILPYIEQQAAYDTMGPTKLNSLGSQMVVNGTIRTAPMIQDMLNTLKTPIAAFICPSDPQTSRTNLRRTGMTQAILASGADGPATAGSPAAAIEVAISNYVAAANSGDCYGSKQSKFPSVAEQLTNPPDGTFCSEKPLRLRDLRDGQSNIIVLSERVYDTTRKNVENRALGTVYPTGAALMYGTRGVGRSAQDGSVGPNCNEAFGSNDALFGGWGKINCMDPSAIWRKFVGVSSRHSGGVNTARGDGSVGFITEQITFAFNNNNTPLVYTDDTPLDTIVAFRQQVTQGETWRQLISVNDGTVLIDPN